ncbi:UPF0193 protein EVG1 isoform X1 [Syngnathus scovelli]|uniref:UPF0193 protein EVG1 isoform X1 n=1 Tax=Syngnathus scovelli TaxID=161590 RepID=UPI002110A218|nr:UPF0193 protein EVG1 isoform X1 [Syngnathus scovelli]
METSSQTKVRGGQWKPTRASKYSKQTQDLLTCKMQVNTNSIDVILFVASLYVCIYPILCTAMMQEFTLSNRQRKKITDCLKDGSALPLTTEPSSSASCLQPKASQCYPKLLPGRPLRRSAVSCRSGNNYVREKFSPAPTRDLEKEKRRLQNILATGQEQEETASHNVAANRKPEVVEEKDRYREVLDEIQERRQFLADMASLGQDKQYSHIINTEISQKIRELEALNGKLSREAVSELSVD